MGWVGWGDSGGRCWEGPGEGGTEAETEAERETGCPGSREARKCERSSNRKRRGIWARETCERENLGRWRLETGKERGQTEKTRWVGVGSAGTGIQWRDECEE